jgi:hypothetical protein
MRVFDTPQISHFTIKMSYCETPSKFCDKRKADAIILLTRAQNDPVLTSPARLNEAIISPLGEVFDLVNVKAASIEPLPNKRFLLSSVTGNILSQNSSKGWNKEAICQIRPGTPSQQ